VFQLGIVLAVDLRHLLVYDHRLLQLFLESIERILVILGLVKHCLPERERERKRKRGRQRASERVREKERESRQREKARDI
jgi:hypothetical protein